MVCAACTAVVQRLLQPDLVLSQTASPANGQIYIGDNVTFVITVANQGEGDASGVTVTQVLAAGLQFAGSAPSGELLWHSHSSHGGWLTWQSPLAAGTMLSLHVCVTHTWAAASGQHASNVERQPVHSK